MQRPVSKDRGSRKGSGARSRAWAGGWGRAFLPARRGVGVGVGDRRFGAYTFGYLREGSAKDNPAGRDGALALAERPPEAATSGRAGRMAETTVRMKPAPGRGRAASGARGRSLARPRLGMRCGWLAFMLTWV